MKVHYAKHNTQELPNSSDCELGDLAMLSGGDVFCFMGDHWKMLGGRWVSPKIKQGFFSYVKSGWPDVKSMEYDLDTLFDISELFETVTDFTANFDKNDIRNNPIWISNFKSKILETCKELQAKSAPAYDI